MLPALILNGGTRSWAEEGLAAEEGERSPFSAPAGERPRDPTLIFRMRRAGFVGVTECCAGGRDLEQHGSSTSATADTAGCNARN